VPACLFDSALPSLDIQQCPGLFTMLDALQLGNLNPPAVCDLSCAMQFSQVGQLASCRKHSLQKRSLQKRSLQGAAAC
jgi:hypothetical protein